MLNRLYSKTLLYTFWRGKVTTYGSISRIVGVDPRIVGYALNKNKDPKNIPCHRVINSKGMISSGYAFGGPNTQRQMLEKEGIKFNQKGTVDLKKYSYM
ncbi:MAG: MGMT family protein [Candidatus Levybacteria bacterium]|nr:MGMT family protein [Candidatus Levybacteria bacterium]